MSPARAPRSAGSELVVRPIGVIRSPFKVHLDAPRQGRLAPSSEGTIELERGLQNLLQDVAGFSHLWVLFWCNYSRGWNAQVVPPRDTRKRGLFATRSPDRPNPIGLTVVELLSVRGTKLRVRGLDMLDGTPVLDLKPYVRYADSIPDASDGWLATLPPEPRPDHRDWTKQPKKAARRAGALLIAAASLLPLGLVGGCGPEQGGARSGRAPAITTPQDDASLLAGDGVLDAEIAAPRKGDESAATAWFQQAVASRGKWRTRDAVRCFERALDVDPAHLGALVEYGFLLLEPGAEQNLGLALLQFRRAQAVVPGQLHALAGEGVARAALHDVARAEPLLRRALDELPEEAVGRRAWSALALADLCAADGRTDEALQLYAQVTADAIPALQRSTALVHVADLLLQLDRPANAEPALRAALVLDPQHVRAHYLLAQLLAKRGDAAAEAAKETRIHELLRQLLDHVSPLYTKDAARRTQLWHELAAAWPENRRLPYSLARDQLDAGDYAGGKATAAELLARDGATAEVSWLAARAAAGGGDLATAKQHLDAMRRADPNAPSTVVRAVLEDWRRGNPDSVDAALFDRTLREWVNGQ